MFYRTLRPSLEMRVTVRCVHTCTVKMSLYWEFPWVPWVTWESHRNGNRWANFMGMADGTGREWELHMFPFPVRGRESTRQCCYISFSGNFGGQWHATVIAHQLRSAMSLTLRISAPQKMINSKASMNWQNMSTRMGMGAGGNGNSQWEWEGNGNKTRLNLWLGMGMNRWKW